MRKLLLVAGFLGAWACSGGGSPPTLPGGGESDGGVTADAGGTGDGGMVGPGTGDAGSGSMGTQDAGPVDAGMAPVTAANPPGGIFMGALSVVLTSTPAATIFYTTDGSDPTTSATTKSGTSPVIVTLSAPARVTLTFFAKGVSGPTETPHSETYSLLEQTTPASITGSLVTHPLMQTANAQTEVFLFDHDPSNGMFNPLSIQSVSPSSPAGANYKFEGLTAGRYWILAAWWPGTPSGNPQAIAFARQNPINLDPSVPAEQRADFVDVYLGECDPQGTGVDGVVVIGSDLLADTVGIAAYSQALTLSNSQTLMPAVAFAPGSGDHRPFALCDLPPGQVNIIAAATPAGMQQPASAIAYSMNPVSTTQVTHATLYLGAPSPSMGGVSGRVTLSGPLPGGSVTVIVTAQPWSDNANIVAYGSIQTGPATQYSYSFDGLANGTYYLTALTKDDAGTTALTKLDQSFVLSSNASQAVMDLNVNVGRVHGNIDVHGAASAPTLVVVGTTPGTPPAGTATLQLGPADANGVSHGTYDVFGVADGTYQTAALFQVAGDTTFQESIQNGHYLVAPFPASIQGGSNVEVDFTGTVP